MFFFSLGLSLLWFLSQAALAASPYKHSLTEKKNMYLRDGVFVGGEAGSGSSLLGVRRLFSEKAQLERVIVDLGDRNSKPAGKNLGYFQASVDPENNRIVLDIAQLKLSVVSEQKLRDTFRKSPFVASVDFTLDPEDRAGTIVLNLKRPMQLEVFELLVDKKPGRIVLDMRPAAVTQMKAGPRR